MVLLRPPTNFLVDRDTVKYTLSTRNHTPGGYKGTKNQCLWKGPIGQLLAWSVGFHRSCQFTLPRCGAKNGRCIFFPGDPSEYQTLP